MVPLVFLIDKSAVHQGLDLGRSSDSVAGLPGSIHSLALVVQLPARLASIFVRLARRGQLLQSSIIAFPCP